MASPEARNDFNINILQGRPLRFGKALHIGMSKVDGAAEIGRNGVGARERYPAQTQKYRHSSHRVLVRS